LRLSPARHRLYGRGRSRSRVETILTSDITAGEIDDSLLQFTTRLEDGGGDHLSETVNLAPLFSTQGATAGAAHHAGFLSARLRNLEATADAALDSGWEPLMPASGLRSGILLLRAEREAVRGGSPDVLRASLRNGGVAATTYPGCLVRLSMPDVDWRPGELDHLCRSLRTMA